MGTPLTVVTAIKQPLGGRCRLYLSYADALASTLGADTEIVESPEAPALIVNDRAVIPTDGVILTAEEIHQALIETGISFGEDLLEILEEVEERFLKEVAP